MVPELSALRVVSDGLDTGSSDAVGLAEAGSGGESELVWPDVGEVVLLAGMNSGDADDKALVSECGASLRPEIEKAGDSLESWIDGAEGVNDTCDDGIPDGDRGDCSEPVDDVEGGLVVSLCRDKVLG